MSKVIDEIEKHNLVFNPTISYEGSFSFNENIDIDEEYNIEHDILYLNALKDKNDNLYERFFEEELYSKIGGADIQKTLRSIILPVVGSFEKENGLGREVKFSIMSSFISLLASMNKLPSDVEHASIDDLYNIIREALREERKELFDVLENKTQSEYFDKYNSVYHFTNKESIKSRIDVRTTLIMSLKYVKELFYKEFPLEKFKKCFDKDKLYLALMKNIVDVNKKTEGSLGLLHNCISDAINYLHICDINPEYDVKIKYYDHDTRKVENYRISDLRKDVAILLGKHPEFKTYNIEIPDVELISHNVNAAMEYVKTIDNLVQSSSLKADWEIIRKGTKGFKEESKDKIGLKLHRSVDVNNRYINLMHRKGVLESLPFLYKIKGRDKFSGYEGYIFENGCVLFEKFYQSDKNNIPASGNATYAMRLDNFIELSKKTKPEIREFIKQNEDAGVRRIYHTKGFWERQVKQLTTGEYRMERYGESLRSYIDSICNTEKELNSEVIKN